MISLGGPPRRDSTADMQGAQITSVKGLAQLLRIATHTYAGPVSRTSGSLFSFRRSHYFAGMLCTVGSQLEWFRRVLSQNGSRDCRTVDSGQLEKALFGPIVLARGPSILAARRAELADIGIQYDWIHRRAYRAELGRPAIFYPSIFKIVSAGPPGDDNSVLEPS